MKKLILIVIAALMIGVAMAKPSTKQERKARKQAEIAAVLEVIKEGRFIIYEPGASFSLTGEKNTVTTVDFTDTTYSELLSIEESAKFYMVEYSSKKIANGIYINTLYFNKKNGAMKIHMFVDERLRDIKIAMYTDVVKLID